MESYNRKELLGYIGRFLANLFILLSVIALILFVLAPPFFGTVELIGSKNIKDALEIVGFGYVILAYVAWPYMLAIAVIDAIIIVYFKKNRNRFDAARFKQYMKINVKGLQVLICILAGAIILAFGADYFLMHTYNGAQIRRNLFGKKYVYPVRPLYSVMDVEPYELDIATKNDTLIYVSGYGLEEVYSLEFLNDEYYPTQIKKSDLDKLDVEHWDRYCFYNESRTSRDTLFVKDNMIIIGLNYEDDIYDTPSDEVMLLKFFAEDPEPVF